MRAMRAIRAKEEKKRDLDPGNTATLYYLRTRFHSPCVGSRGSFYGTGYAGPFQTSKCGVFHGQTIPLSSRWFIRRVRYLQTFAEDARTLDSGPRRHKFRLLERPRDSCNRSCASRKGQSRIESTVGSRRRSEKSYGVYISIAVLFHTHDRDTSTGI